VGRLRDPLRNLVEGVELHAVRCRETSPGTSYSASSAWSPLKVSVNARL
jgi:hypothetical protein